MQDQVTRKTIINFGKYEGKCVSELIAKKKFEFLLEAHNNQPRFKLPNKLLKLVLDGKEKLNKPPISNLPARYQPQSRHAMYAQEDLDNIYGWDYG